MNSLKAQPLVLDPIPAKSRSEIYRVIEILRAESGPEGTFGVLRIQKKLFCVTLEPPYRDNVPNISCIPTGVYWCTRTDSERFGETFAVQDVHGRSFIEFHPGNWVINTRGCILLGESVGKLRGRRGESRGILNSGNTFKSFMNLLGDAECFHMTISDNY